ncbi:MAG: efflux RND transporter periplasmic adaptor subunit [Pseudomonadota bacterium]|nr:efflux RND transporter periplasmic adaptor subunit [Pseudomonadota bacterium]
MQKLLNILKTIAKTIVNKPLLIVLVTILALVLMVMTRPRMAPVDLPERIWPVDVVEIYKSDYQPTLELFGQVISGRRSELRSRVPGPIVKVGQNFREGALVQEGELLVQIDPFEYSNDVNEQKALLTEAQVDLEITRRDLTRIRDLYDENNVSEQNLDDATLALEQRQATLEQRRIGLLRAERALTDARLIAPYEGVLNGVAAELGKQLSMNDQIAEIIDMSRLEVRFALSKAQLGRLLEANENIEGRSVEILWQVGDETLTYSAVVERIGAEIDSSTGGVGLYGVIESDAKTLLRPGAFVWARVLDKNYQNVFKVPESALYGADQVYVVVNGRLEMRNIEVKGFDGDDMLFVASGDPAIIDGDKVVTNQIREGGVGIKVEIR